MSRIKPWAYVLMFVMLLICMDWAIHILSPYRFDF
jgi:hypothetical protein